MHQIRLRNLSGIIIVDFKLLQVHLHLFINLSFISCKDHVIKIIIQSYDPKIHPGFSTPKQHLRSNPTGIWQARHTFMGVHIPVKQAQHY